MVVKYVVLDMGVNDVGLFQTKEGAANMIGVSTLTFSKFLLNGCDYYGRFKVFRDVEVGRKRGNGFGFGGR